MSGSSRSRRKPKPKLEPISYEEMLGTAGMSGFVSFLNVTPAGAAKPQDLPPNAGISHPDEAPAAMRVHHAYGAGLLDHSLSLCQLIEMLVQKYPRLSRDWLV